MPIRLTGMKTLQLPVSIASHRTFTLFAVALALGAGCRRGKAPELTEAGVHERAAFLSVAGTSASDVWVAGAQNVPQGPGTLLHYDGSAWSEKEVPSLHDLWWVHAFDDGTLYAAGAGATVLRVDGDTITREDTPVFFGNTVYGVWGTSPDDAWAVGGFAGRDGFAWRTTGGAWEPVDLPDDLPLSPIGEPPSLFKVWGRSSDDVWIVGGLGAVLHWDGTSIQRIESGTDTTLLTVVGLPEEADEDVVIVGGLTGGTVLKGGIDGFVDDSPPGAPLLQGVTVDADGAIWVAGEGGYAARQRPGKDWEIVDLGFSDNPQSVHALWAAPDDPDTVWAVGGRVLSPELDLGAIAATGEPPLYTPDPLPEPDLSCPDDAVDLLPDASIARRWIELLLDSIRRDFPHPPKHARNLHHTSVAMYDAWATYQDVSQGVVYTERHPGTATLEDDREIAISYAALRVMQERYDNAIGGETSLDCYDRFMDEVLGLDPTDTHVDGDDPIAVGNRIGFAVVDRFIDDGATDADNELVDTTNWEPTNPVMVVDLAGTNVEDPDVWQQLNLGVAETQNGIVLDDSVQPYIGPHWRNVEPFAIEIDPTTGLYSDIGPGVPPVESEEMAEQVVQVVRKTAELDIDEGVMIDISPASRGNNTLGTDDGTGYDLNPITGQPYAPNLVNRGDFTRVVAEIWADGPSSQTPPGHWFSIANETSDLMEPDDYVPWGIGEPVDRLTWDIGIYLTVGGAVHDAAISAWELKRETLGPRPITLIRWMAQQGQRTEPDAPDYSPVGIPLVPGLIERITPESSAPGERHHALRYYEGEIAVFSWPGEPGDREADHTPLRWMRAADWIPYQRRTFVTPAFPGYTSGHSTFSRAGAEALAQWTGSPYFPGGMYELVAEAGYLVFEAGPETDVRLQFATYYDASDEAGQSRLWGGIHVFADDRYGRINGQMVGEAVSERARQLWTGTAP
jgi:hypothetical protein